MPARLALRGTVSVTADLAARYTVFAVCLQRLQLPAGSQVQWHLGSDVASNRNRAVREVQGDWLWFIDDDHAFQPDILLRLLSHEVDIVTPICLRRAGNFLPVPVVDGEILDLDGHDPDELIEVESAGTAGMLIRRSVFDRIDDPWFEMRNGRSEDVVFCEKLRETGIPIHVDLGARLGHVTTATVWPDFQDDRWSTGFTFADGFKVAVDLAAV